MLKKKKNVSGKMGKVIFDGMRVAFYHLEKRSNWVCDSYWFCGSVQWIFSFVSLVWEGLSVCF